MNPLIGSLIINFKKIPLINQIQNSSNIEFTISEEEVKEKICKYIEGFTIKIQESLIEPAEEQSRILTRNLKNIITIIYLYLILYFHKRIVLIELL